MAMKIGDNKVYLKMVRGDDNLKVSLYLHNRRTYFVEVKKDGRIIEEFTFDNKPAAEKKFDDIQKSF